MWTCGTKNPKIVSQSWNVNTTTNSIYATVNGTNYCIDLWSYYSCHDPSSPISSLPFCDITVPPKLRARDLVSRMDLREKIYNMDTESNAIGRLGVVQYNWWSEALHGVVGGGTATSFPQVIGIGAGFNISAVHEEAKIISTEARAKNNQGLYGLTYFAPNINIFRDPRWGRGQG